MRSSLERFTWKSRVIQKMTGWHSHIVAEIRNFRRVAISRHGTKAPMSRFRQQLGDSNFERVTSLLSTNDCTMKTTHERHDPIKKTSY